jgi:hypothetical protein
MGGSTIGKTGVNGSMRYQTFRFERLDSRSLFRQLGWRGIAALAVGTALLVATFLAAAGLFLILLPIFLVAGLVARFFLGRKRQAPQHYRPESPSVIEGRYEVVSEPEPTPGRGWGPRPGEPRR